MRIFIAILFIMLFGDCNDSISKGSNAHQSAGLINGMQIQYYSNGQIKIQGNMKEGERNGLWESFFEDGRRWSESTYNNGELHGSTKVYYPNGFLMYVGMFSSGKRSGQWVFYQEDGKIDYKKDY